jgi:hypothetical protein
VTAAGRPQSVAARAVRARTPLACEAASGRGVAPT